MVYSVRADEKADFAVKPESTEAEVLQNIHLLLNANRYSIPLAREMGRRLDVIGENIQIAEMLEHQNVLDLIEEYEPRAKVTKLDFDIDSAKGRLIPVLEVDING